MMQYIEAPDMAAARYPSVFLAGGITNCPDWQARLARWISSLPVTVFNPRRAEFPMDDPSAAFEQIEWEYNRLREADALVFWFSAGTDNPIVLFEYGAALERKQPLYVGIDEDYSRRLDVEIQTKLRRPDLKIVYNLAHIAARIAWLDMQPKG